LETERDEIESALAEKREIFIRESEIPPYVIAHGIMIVTKDENSALRKVFYESKKQRIPFTSVNRAIDSLTAINNDPQLKNNWSEAAALVAGMCLDEVEYVADNIHYREAGLKKMPLNLSFEERCRIAAQVGLEIRRERDEQEPQLSEEEATLKAVRYLNGLEDNSVLEKCFRGVVTVNNDSVKVIVRQVEKEARILFRILRAMHEHDIQKPMAEMLGDLSKKLGGEDPLLIRYSHYADLFKSTERAGFPVEPTLEQVKENLGRIIEQ
jgi:hypothetical protein